jgi:hypothetical protein
VIHTPGDLELLPATAVRKDGAKQAQTTRARASQADAAERQLADIALIRTALFRVLTRDNPAYRSEPF